MNNNSGPLPENDRLKQPWFTSKRFYFMYRIRTTQYRIRVFDETAIPVRNESRRRFRQREEITNKGFFAPARVTRYEWNTGVLRPR